MRIANIAALAVTCYLAGSGLQDSKLLPSATVFDDPHFRVSCDDMQTIRISDQEYFERMEAIEMTATEAIEIGERYLLDERRVTKAECINLDIVLEGKAHFRAEFMTETQSEEGESQYARWKLQIGLKGKRVKSCFPGYRLPGTVVRSPMLEMPNGMLYNDIKVGDGAAVRRGSTVRIDYVLSLLDGSLVTNTHDQDSSRSFQIENAEFEGLAAGLLGMRAGGKRKLVVPPSLGYGRAGYKEFVPPEATLVIDVVLRTVE